MNCITKKLVMNYVTKKVNETLDENKDDVTKITTVIEDWIVRLQIVIEQLKRINCRVADGRVESDEIEASIDEIKAIVENWK